MCSAWKCFVEKHKKLKPCKSAVHNSIPSLVIPIVTSSPRVFKSAYRASTHKQLLKQPARCVVKSPKVHKIYWFLDTQNIFCGGEPVHSDASLVLSLFMGFYWHSIHIFLRCRPIGDNLWQCSNLLWDFSVKSSWDSPSIYWRAQRWRQESARVHK